MVRQAAQTVQNATASPLQAADGGVARSAHLDASLDRAHKLAVGQRHSGVSSEHLLFALTEDPEALTVLGASPINVTIDIERLRADIGAHLSRLLGDAPAGKPILPNADLLKVLKLAAMAAQQSARRQIDGAIVLAAMIGDASTPSAGLLRAHGLTFNEVIKVLQKSTAQVAAPVAAPAMPTTEPPTARIGATAEPASARAPDMPASTDELLASVRARLQEAAPKARRVEKLEAAPAEASAAAPTALAPQMRDDAPTVALTTSRPAEPAPKTPAQIAEVPAAPAAPRAEAVMPAIAAPMAQAAMSPPMPLARQDAPPVINPVTQPVTLPPLPLVPAGNSAAATGATPRVGPPPMPLAAMAGAPVPKSMLPLQQPLVPASAAPGVRVQVPPPVVDVRALAAAMPKRMRQGQTSIVEITIPRRSLEIPMAPGHRWPPLRVTTMRLRAPVEAAHVELASPETLWISPPRVHQGAGDDAIWRWRVTPRTGGYLKLQLAGATRIVGGEGISGEVPLGEETVEVDVARPGSRRWLVGVLVFGNLLALGLLAMMMSGRASEMMGAAWGWTHGLIGN